MIHKFRKQNHKKYTKHNRSYKTKSKTIKNYSNAHSIAHSNAHSNISLLTYNISWESMTGAKSNWALCSNNTDPKHPKHNSVCIGNIAQVIEQNPVDFVCLQEATNFKTLINESLQLKKMK